MQAKVLNLVESCTVAESEGRQKFQLSRVYSCSILSRMIQAGLMILRCDHLSSKLIAKLPNLALCLKGRMVEEHFFLVSLHLKLVIIFELFG